MSVRKFHHISEFSRAGYESLLVPPPAIRTAFWPKFDELVGGLRPHEYSILCGSTGAGKTAWTASLVEQVASQGSACFVASVETGPVDFFRRIISARAKRNWNQGDTVSVNALEMFRTKNPSFERDIPIYIATYEDRVKNEELMVQVEMSIASCNVELVVLDNLNFFMEVTTNQNTVLEMDRVVHQWIMFAKQHKAHIVMIMHPKKTQEGRVESEFDIKGSSTAVQEAHNVWLFNRLPKQALAEDPYGYNARELTIAKCRRIGRGVGRSILFRSEDDGASYVESMARKSVQSDVRPFRPSNDVGDESRFSQMDWMHE